MTSGPHKRVTGPPAIVAAQPHRLPARLTLHPADSPADSLAGGLDGTWWPRSLDLSVELPGLISAAAVRVEHVTEAVYHPASWDTTVRHLVAEGRVVRLTSRPGRPAEVLTLTGADQQTLSLLVVPPDQDDCPGD
jgi:hypothetical protein